MISEFKKGERSSLSDHFNISEFHCHCHYSDCDVTYIDTELIEYLEKKRVEIGDHIIVDSGFRCTRHNRDVGGKKGSQHLIGKAADIHVDSLTPEKLADLCEDASGLGRYPNKKFIHVDIRYGYGDNLLKKARWIG